MAEETGMVAVEARRGKGEEVLEEEEEEVTVCEVCRVGDREHLLLLCDGCDLGHHTTCLTPRLPQVSHHTTPHTTIISPL